MMTPVTKYKRLDSCDRDSRYTVSRKNRYACGFTVRTKFLAAFFGVKYATQFTVSDGRPVKESRSR